MHNIQTCERGETSHHYRRKSFELNGKNPHIRSTGGGTGREQRSVYNGPVAVSR